CAPRRLPSLSAPAWMRQRFRTHTKERPEKSSPTALADTAASGGRMKTADPSTVHRAETRPPTGPPQGERYQRALPPPANPQFSPLRVPKLEAPAVVASPPLLRGMSPPDSTDSPALFFKRQGISTLGNTKA